MFIDRLMTHFTKVDNIIIFIGDNIISLQIMKLPHENLNSATTETIMNLISREVDVFPMVGCCFIQIVA